MRTAAPTGPLQVAARTFLLELRAKGYHPQVIVTDLCADYREPLAAVFPNACHHECLFTDTHRQVPIARYLRDHSLRPLLPAPSDVVPR